MTKLSPNELMRYSRHLILPDVGIEGQIKLREAKVLLVGLGGLGSPTALYLAASGIGKLGLIDYDVVEYTNLQRQIIHTTEDVGHSKLFSARDKIHAINPDVTVELYETKLSSQNALPLFHEYDIVIDGTDNFPTRYLVNDACILTGKPNIYGSVFQFEGQASVFATKGGPCYRCLYPEPPLPGEVPNCAEGGVLGVMPGIIGTIQATEAIKLIIGKGELLIGRLLFFEALTMHFHEIKLKRNPDCPVCGDHPTIKELIDYAHSCSTRPVETVTGGGNEITVEELKVMLDSGKKIYLLDVRDQYEYQICHLKDSHLIPQKEIRNRLHELDDTLPIIVYCKSGTRSKQVQEFLFKKGFKNVKNLCDGISAWSSRIDSSMLNY